MIRRNAKIYEEKKTLLESVQLIRMKKHMNAVSYRLHHHKNELTKIGIINIAWNQVVCLIAVVVGAVLYLTIFY